MSKGRRMVSDSSAAAKPRKGHDVAGWFAQALLYDQMGRAAEAQALYREILKERPNHFDSLHRLGISEYQSGQVEAAARSIGRAVLIDPQSAAAHSNLATVLLALHRHDEALACCDKAIALKADYADAHFNRGIALYGLKRFEDAVQSFETAIGSIRVMRTPSTTWATPCTGSDAFAMPSRVTTRRLAFGPATCWLSTIAAPPTRN